MMLVRGAAIAHWIRLHLPSCRPGSSPKHAIYDFSFKVFVLYLSFEKNKINKKRPGLAHFENKE